MAYEFYVRIEGVKQGKFKGEGIKESRSGEWMPGIGYCHEIKSPRDVSTGHAAGKRQHGAICFTKEWGAASPMLFQALCTNEHLKKVDFEFIKTNPNGEEYVYHTITLFNATVSSIKYNTGKGESAGSARTTATYDTHELEDVSLTYEKIVMENKDGKTMAEDDWKK